MTDEQAQTVLNELSRLSNWVEWDSVTNPNLPPESLSAGFENDHGCPEDVIDSGAEPLYRVSLDAVAQVLLLIGPIVGEWQRVEFSSEFELLERIIHRVNEISTQLGEMAESVDNVEDEPFELSYRAYLLQRFFRVEAGTVRMTTNVNVDVRELFVMPRAAIIAVKKAEQADGNIADLMDLAEARKIFQAERETDAETDGDESGPSVLEHVRNSRRCVIIGTPGSGKSTFLEWLQLRIANGDEELILDGQQAIPLLLRVRQLDPLNLPRGAVLIEKATASKDRASLMPTDWIDRQTHAGRVLVMVDGLDETEPNLRDRYVLPWLEELCSAFSECKFIVSTRPAGYPGGVLRQLDFVECELRDFGPQQVEEYCQHWCTAVRLSQNEAVKEARREGQTDGNKIVTGFQEHLYIRDLARNPLMLSAICLVNYFEGGQLPDDRAKLYQLCVEGLLHHWDQRRGIHSEYSLDEKLRVCREVAIAGQAENLAEYNESTVREILAAAMSDVAAADRLLEHIRYRTGLLVERRAGVYAFAHLTFQEYLAACAINEGNLLKIEMQRLAEEHNDSRWREVIALFCGLAPAPIARQLILNVADQDDIDQLGAVLADSFFAAGKELRNDQSLMDSVIRRIAVAPHGNAESLTKFAEEDVAHIANSSIGTIASENFSNAHRWLSGHTQCLDWGVLESKIADWRTLSAHQLSELTAIFRMFAGSDQLQKHFDTDIYSAPSTPNHHIQAGLVFLIWLVVPREPDYPASFAAVPVLRALADATEFDGAVFQHWVDRQSRREQFESFKVKESDRKQVASLVTKIAQRPAARSQSPETPDRTGDGAESFFHKWAKYLSNPALE